MIRILETQSAELPFSLEVRPLSDDANQRTRTRHPTTSLSHLPRTTDTPPPPPPPARPTVSRRNSTLAERIAVIKEISEKIDHDAMSLMNNQTYWKATQVDGEEISISVN
jgi:hypothetical protein